MKKRIRLSAIMLLLLLVTTVLPVPASANAAEPPGLTVLVTNSPQYLELSLRFPDGTQATEVQLNSSKKAWESYHKFFYHAVASKTNLERAILVVTSNEGQFECPLPEGSSSTYNNLLTLDLETQQLVHGQPPMRVPLLVALRVSLTLLIEGAVFFLLGYRKTYSWLVFLLVNLLTQGALNLMLTGPNLSGYWMLGYLLGECAVLAIELIAFLPLLKERSKGWAITHVILANFASLLIGGLLITYLPV